MVLLHFHFYILNVTEVTNFLPRTDKRCYTNTIGRQCKHFASIKKQNKTKQKTAEFYQ